MIMLLIKSIALYLMLVVFAALNLRNYGSSNEMAFRNYEIGLSSM
jgi:hypothetical protein